MQLGFGICDSSLFDDHCCSAYFRHIQDRGGTGAAHVLAFWDSLCSPVCEEGGTTSEGDVKMWIALEGMDGTGKSTVAKALQGYFFSQGMHALALSDPGGWSMGSLFREVVLEKQDWTRGEGSFKGWHPLARRFLLAADFVQMYHEQILPGLAAGHIIISDRLGYISGRIYGTADGVSEDVINQVIDMITPGKPDYIFVLDAPDEELQRRLAARGKADFYDKKPAEYRRKIRSGYEDVVTKLGGILIPTCSVEQVVGDIIRHIEGSEARETDENSLLD